MEGKTVKKEKSLNEFTKMRERLHSQEQPNDESKGFIEAQSTLKKVFDTMQIGVTISDVNGGILYVNPADAEMHGYKVEELLGEDVRVFAPTKRWNPMNPEEIEKRKRQSAERRKHIYRTADV
jgi:PAS domain-containing protein